MKSIIIILLLLLAVSCSTKMTNISAEYEKSFINGQELSVVFNDYYLDIKNPQDFDMVYKNTNRDSMFLAVFKKHFSNSLHRSSTFSNISYHLDFDNTDLELREYSLINSGSWDELFKEIKTKYRVWLPKNGEVVTFAKKEPKFILFIQKISTTQNEGQASTMHWQYNGEGMGPQAIGSPGSPDRLVITLTYAFWDNTKGKVIASGKVHDYASIFYSIKQSTWRKAIKDLTLRIVDNSPFAKKK
jgi:hypothetical protein